MCRPSRKDEESRKAFRVRRQLQNAPPDIPPRDRRYETPPIFKEYNKNIEEKNINYFHIRIYNRKNEDEDMTIY